MCTREKHDRPLDVVVVETTEWSITYCVNVLGKPGMFDLKGKKKWEYWTNLKGTSKEECQEKYIAKVEEFVGKYRD